MESAATPEELSFGIAGPTAGIPSANGPSGGNQHWNERTFKSSRPLDQMQMLKMHGAGAPAKRAATVWGTGGHMGLGDGAVCRCTENGQVNDQ